jgi:hypothetical protein
MADLLSDGKQTVILYAQNPVMAIVTPKYYVALLAFTIYNYFSKSA